MAWTQNLPPRVCRAFNNWLADFCNTNRARLKPAALLPVHDVKLAEAEARRSVKELGAVALVLPNQQVNGRPWYDRYYDPLWAEAERLHVPVAFHGIRWPTRSIWDGVISITSLWRTPWAIQWR